MFTSVDNEDVVIVIGYNLWDMVQNKTLAARCTRPISIVPLVHNR